MQNNYSVKLKHHAMCNDKRSQNNKSMPNNALLRPYDVCQSMPGNDNGHATNDAIHTWMTRGMCVSKRRTDSRM